MNGLLRLLSFLPHFPLRRCGFAPLREIKNRTTRSLAISRLFISPPAVFCIAIVLGILAGPAAAAGFAAGPKVPAEKPRPRITISKETTYLTGPLRPDGYVDYVGALNAELSRGVAPENNAVVPLMLAFGPKAVGEKQRAAFFKLLGVPVPPEKGPYFVSLDQYITRLHDESRVGRAERAPPKGEPPPAAVDVTKESQEVWVQLEQAQKRPWSQEEFPTIAGWLEANREPLRRIEEAAGRPRSYAPLVPAGDPPMLTVLLPVCQSMRDAACMLGTRAMLRVHQGKRDEAWRDLLACHRLARHAGQGPTLVEGLIAIVVERAAAGGDAALAHYGRPTAAVIGRMKSDLAALPAMPKMADRLDQGERFFYLDAVATMARKGVSNLRDLAGGGPAGDKSRGLLEELVFAGLDAMIDWDEPLRMGNPWYDRLAAAARKPTRAERVTAMAALEKDIKALAVGVKDPKRIPMRFVERMPAQAIGHWMGEVLGALLLPAVSSVIRAEDRAAAETTLRDVALALAAYRADHGEYPGRLADLKPKYRADLNDPFSDGELIYRTAADGFLLYSVGPNGKDDGGRNRSDYSGDPSPPPESSQWDDLAVRMPVSPRKSH